MHRSSGGRARVAAEKGLVLCELCGRETSHRSSLGDPSSGPSLIECEDCGLVRLREFPDPELLQRAYQDAYYQAESASRFVAPVEALVSAFRRLRVRDICRRQPVPAGLLDVGCGRGILLQQLQEEGWRVIGTQISRTAAAVAVAQRGVDVRVGELPELDLEPGSFRVITLYHVLEHLVHPRSYLAACQGLLEDGGLLVVEVPNFASPGFRVLGLDDLCFDFPHHLFFFTPRTLAELLVREGFEVEEVSHFSLEYSPITTLQNLLNAIPGRKNRLLDALRVTDGERPLLREPATWAHGVGALLLAPVAALLSLAALVAPIGNTIRIYCRKRGRVEAKGAGGAGGRPR